MHRPEAEERSGRLLKGRDWNLIRRGLHRAEAEERIRMASKGERQ